MRATGDLGGRRNAVTGPETVIDPRAPADTNWNEEGPDPPDPQEREHIMPSKITVVPLLAVLSTGLACASTGQTSDGEFFSRNVITRQQIQEVRATNAYEVVERLKSHWLRSVTPTSPNNLEQRTHPVSVYQDGQRLGYVGQLRRIEVAAIDHIRYFSPAEASARWGRGNSGGAIQVITQPGGP